MIVNVRLNIGTSEMIVSYLEIYDWIKFLDWFEIHKRRRGYYYVSDLHWWMEKEFDDPSEDVFPVIVKYEKVLNKWSYERRFLMTQGVYNSLLNYKDDIKGTIDFYIEKVEK